MKTKRTIYLRIDSGVLMAIDQAATNLSTPDRSFIIEGILSNAVSIMRGRELYYYALEGIKKVSTI